MNVGIVWPTPGPTGAIDPTILAHIRSLCGATHCRFNIDYRHPDPISLVESVLEGGCVPLPILDFEYNHQPDQKLFIDFCVQIVETCGFSLVELLNEPRILGKWSGTQYGKFISPVCEALLGHTEVMIAGDYLIADRKGPKIIKSWMEAVCEEVPDVNYQVVALHTYREPAPPHITRHNSRAEEFVAMYTPIPLGKRIQITEVGWNLVGVTQEQQAAYISHELTINETLGIEATYLYSGIAGLPELDFGLVNHDLTPRPSAEAIRQWQVVHGMA